MPGNGIGVVKFVLISDENLSLMIRLAQDVTVDGNTDLFNFWRNVRKLCDFYRSSLEMQESKLSFHVPLLEVVLLVQSIGLEPE